MQTMTGIELGPDYCVLVRARRREALVEVTALRVVEADEWPANLPARMGVLEKARRELKLPRRAMVVAWDLAAFGVNSSEAMLRGAGFEVDRVLSPTDALALLAWTRPHAEAHEPVAWLSINRHGAGIAVVRDHDLLYGSEFAWRIRAPDQRAQAHLLRRYLYVAQLVPEIRKAMAVVGAQQKLTVGTAVACGNITDLRSFTMPLIDALDIEFETLDSLEGFQMPVDFAGAVAEAAPAIRLAGAAAAFGESTAGVGTTVRLLGAAAGLMLAAGAAWWAFSVWGAALSAPEAPRRDRRPAVAAQGRGSSSRPAVDRPAPRAESTPASPTGRSTRPQTGLPPDRAGEPGRRDPRAASPVEEERPRPQPTAGKSGARAVGGSAEAAPFPVVGGILISENRRLAVIDGVVVGVGDRVGERTVVAIETDAVVFREPGGREVRVPVRDRSR